MTTTGLFINNNYLTKTLEIDLEDYDPVSGHAVWRTNLDGDKRFTEGHIDDDGWLIVNRAFHAYDDEEGAV